jgi:hypothetical protein
VATTRVKRPPAQVRFVPAEVPQPSTVTAPIAVHGFTYHTQYVVNVNPIKTVPLPIQPSLSQPISIAGWGRSVRTHMGTPYAQRGGMGRVAHVGHFIGHNSERGQMAGAFARGFTYVSPAPDLGPGEGRTQAIGGSGQGGRRRRG